jgi:DnaJ-class molecular chaperone
VARWARRSGDLYVELAVAEHEVFKRHGDDLEMVVKVPMTAAALRHHGRHRTLPSATTPIPPT